MKKVIGIIVLILIVLGSVFAINFLGEKNANSKAPTKPKEEYENYDTDGDGLSDDEEKELGTDTNSNDTDNDGLTDLEESLNKTDPQNEDTDGDGLLDGKSIVINGIEIAPKDPDPLNKNGREGLWIKHINDYKTKNIPTSLSSDIKYLQNGTSLQDFNTNNLMKPETLSLDFITKVLFFKPDTYKNVLHSQTQKEIIKDIKLLAKSKLSPLKYQAFIQTMEYYNLDNKIDTWQRKFGYNKLYDDVFRKSVKNNMQAEQIYFKDLLNIDHAIWMWKGDYLALGTGAEIGIYVRSEKQQFFDKYNVKHWDSVDFELPMTLNLYNYTEDNIETIFNWKPINKQWWITGFNPKRKNLNVKNQSIVGSIDFSSRNDMYSSIKSENKYRNDILIFDDENKKLWIAW